jgi:hypothetical protein
MEQKENIFKVLQLLHRAMLAGMVLFCLIALFLVITGQTKYVATFTGKALQVTEIVVVFLFAGGGSLLFNKKIQSTTTVETAAERMRIYRTSVIIRWAMTEIPVLFAIIAFVLTGNYAFLALATVLMVLFALIAPAKNKIIQLLQLNDQDVRQMEGQSE